MTTEATVALNDAWDVRGRYFFIGREDVREEVVLDQRPATDLVKDLGDCRLHPRAESGREHEADDLAEAIALAHDLGHTPFGHAGQDAPDYAID